MYKLEYRNYKNEVILVRTATRQGDSLSAILFSIALKKVIREMNMEQHRGENLQKNTWPNIYEIVTK